MGREVKRVALDADLPIGEIYSGYLMPTELQPDPCTCYIGYSEFGERLHRQWYGQAPFDPSMTGSQPITPDCPGVLDNCRRKIEWSRQNPLQGQSPDFYDRLYGTTGEATVRVEAERMCRFWNSYWSCHLDQETVDAIDAAEGFGSLTHDFDKTERKWVRRDPTRKLTAREVSLYNALAPMGVSGGMGIAMRIMAERHGQSLSCSICGGEGSIFRTEEQRAAHDAWEATEPPVGEGWQMWETVTEGSPISPIFETPEELARYLAASEDSGIAGRRVSYDSWMKMIVGDGWAPSMVMTNGQIMSGVEAAARDYQ